MSFIQKKRNVDEPQDLRWSYSPLQLPLLNHIEMRFQSSFKLVGGLMLPALLANCMPHINDRTILTETSSSMPSEMELTLFDDDAVYGTVNLVDGQINNDIYMFYRVENGWKSEGYRRPVAYAQTRLDKGKMPEVVEALAKEKTPKLIKYGDDDGRPVRQYWIIAEGTVEDGQAVMDKLMV